MRVGQFTDLVLLVGFVVFATSCGGPSTSAGPARAALTVGTYNHGAHFIGEEVKGELTIANMGQTPFEVETVTASCSCTTTVPPENSVAPGASVSVGYALTGHVPATRTIFLKPRTNPASAEPLTFEAKVTWKGRIDADPTDLAPQFTYGEPVAWRIPLRRAEGITRLRVTGVKVLPQNQFAARLEPSSDPSGLPGIAVSANKAFQPGRYGARLAVEYDDGGPGVQSMAFTVSVLSKVAAEPEKLTIDFEKGAKKEVPVEIVLRSRTNEPFSVSSILCENCTLGSEPLPKGAATEHRIPLTVVRTVEDPTPGFIVFNLGPELGLLRVQLQYVR